MEKLDENKKRSLSEFVDMMKSLYGGGLVSLSLFGEGGLVEPGADHRGLKVLAVMRSVGPDELKKYADVHHKWLKKGIPAPLMLTRDTLRSSTDVFPIEFLEMKETYTLLHGEDVLAGLEIGMDNLRRECEWQIKGKFIHLRQAYMESGGDKKALAHVVSASVDHFTEAMRNMLRLMGKEAPVRKDEAVERFCDAAGLSERPFLDALRIRREGLTPPKAELDALFAGYLDEIGKMAEIVDKMAPGV